MAWYRRWPFVSGIALLSITNAVVLAGVIHNRSGAADSTLTLTNRELTVPYSYWQSREDTGLSLSVRWRVEPSETRHNESPNVVSYHGEPAWLDAAKLEQLGIRVRARALRNAGNPSYSRSLPVDVLLVLEMNGAAYQRELERACKRATDNKEARDNCAREENEASRLFIVDAGLDRDTLRKKYPDTKTHAIVHGQIAATRMSDATSSSVVGQIRGMSVEQIQVPVEMHAPFGPGTLARWSERPSFEATVSFGRRLEPWLVTLSGPPAQ
jgi:hypothetical protein